MMARENLALRTRRTPDNRITLVYQTRFGFGICVGLSPYISIPDFRDQPALVLENLETNRLESKQEKY